MSVVSTDGVLEMLEEGGLKTHVACCWRHQFDKTLARPGYAVCGGFPDVDASGAVGLRGAPVGFADV